jgi:translation initiation factor IF-1
VPGGGGEAKVSPIKVETSKGVSLVCHLHIRDFSELTSENAASLRKWIRLLESDSVEVEVSPQQGNSREAGG